MKQGRIVKLFGRTVYESVNKEAEQRNFSSDLETVLYQMMTGLNSAYVSEESSLAFSAVWSCVRVLSESVAILPMNIMYRDDKENRTVAKTHPLYNFIKRKPNPWTTSYTWRSVIMAQLALWGNAYVRIYRNSVNYYKISLVPLNPSKVKAVLNKGELFYHIADTGEMVSSYDMLHFKGLTLDGITGKSPIAVARENIQLGLAAQTFGKSFFENGARPTGAFKTPAKLDDAQFKRLQSLVTQMYTGASNAGKPLLLEGGLDFAAFTIPPEDAQFLQTRKFSIEEVARLYRVPPHMIASLERSTNNNIEMQDTEFWRDAVAPYCRNIEEEMNTKLLTEKEQDNYYFNFNMKAMMRGDMQSRAAFYQMLFNSGALSPNDILKLEDMNGYEGGDDKYLQLNLAPVKSFEKYLNNGKN